jgi:hypothetical protein
MKIYWLIVFVPAAIGSALLGVNPSLVFVLAFLGMIPLAALLSVIVVLTGLVHVFEGFRTGPMRNTN